MQKHLFFDLDHTLWDFESNAEDTLRELYDHYQMADRSPYSASEFIAIYKKINDDLWDLYRKHQVSKQELRTKRFHDTFLKMGFAAKDVPTDLWEHYIQVCPTKTRLMPHAMETLNYLLDQDYALHLITNGFAETQRRKLHYSGLTDYFKSLTISEEVGAQKPSPVIFHQALENAGTHGDGQYVGDSHDADVRGGLNAGWKVYWLHQDHPESEFDQHPALQKIKDLSELKTHF